MRPVQLFATFVSFSVLASAWPWPEFENKALGGLDALLHRRQNSNSDSNTQNTNSATNTNTNTNTNTGKTTVTGKTSATTGSNKNTASTASKTASGSGSAATATDGGDSGNSTSSAASSQTTAFDSRDPPGSVVMITPGIFSPSQYYKVNDWVTFAWNYTSIQGTPTAVDVVAACSSNQATYTLASNLTFNAAGQTLLWDTNGYDATATQKLLTGLYTLMVVDADLGFADATVVPGRLSPVQALRFGMYTPQSYTPLSDGWVCATCSGAMSSTEKQTLSFLFGMASITILSFSWFATGRFGVL